MIKFTLKYTHMPDHGEEKSDRNDHRKHEDPKFCRHLGPTLDYNMPVNAPISASTFTRGGQVEVLSRVLSVLLNPLDRSP